MTDESPEQPAPIPLSDEDTKLVVLARGARSRIQAPEGAAVRDDTGRTYAAATVSLPTLAVSALGLAVAQAAAGGAGGLEAAVVVTAAGTVPAADLSAVRDLAGPGVPVHVAGPDAVLQLTLTS